MVAAWQFLDIGSSTNYTFEQNPNAQKPLFGPKQISIATTSSVTGQPIVYEAKTGPNSWSFTGVCRSQAFHDSLLGWSNTQALIYLIDHVGRRLTIYPEQFLPTPKIIANNLWYYTYSFDALLFKVENNTNGKFTQVWPS